MFEKIANELQDAFLLKRQYFYDDRGVFQKIYEENWIKELGIDFTPTETLVSVSKKGVIRGLHFQKPHYQTKLVSCLQGSLWDVIVDTRPDSPTYGKWQGFELSSDNGLMLLVPKGFAHGFQALQDQTVCCYGCDGKFEPTEDGGINAFSKSLSIPWPLTDLIQSEKDQNLPEFII